MSNCPICDVPMEAERYLDQPLAACPQCGGVWMAGQDLAQLARNAPANLAELDARHVGTGHAGLPVYRSAPECPLCHGELTERTFPVAPDLPLLACAPCKQIFLRDGQLRQLQTILAPTAPLPPGRTIENLAPPRPEARPRRPRETEPVGLWPERTPGQPWLSWAVLGMPLWLTAVVLLVPALIMSLLGAGDPEVGAAAWVWMIAIYPYWLFNTLLLTLALHITWMLGEGGAGLTFGESYLGLLRVTAVSMVATAAAAAIVAVGGLGMGVFLGIVLLVNFLLYRQVMELEFSELLIIAVLNSFLGGGLGF